MCVHKCRSLQRLEEGVRFPEARVPGSYELRPPPMWELGTDVLFTIDCLQLSIPRDGHFYEQTENLIFQRGPRLEYGRWKLWGEVSLWAQSPSLNMVLPPSLILVGNLLAMFNTSALWETMNHRYLQCLGFPFDHPFQRCSQSLPLVLPQVVILTAPELPWTNV